MNILANLKLKYKLGLMVLAPVPGLLYFAQAEVRSNLDLRNEQIQLAQLAQFATRASTMVHELQKERGASAGFLGINGEKLKTELMAQRTETDRKVKDLNAFLAGFDAGIFSSEFEGGLGDALKVVADLGDKRAAISALNIPTKQAIGYYTGLNGRFLGLIGSLAKLSSDGGFSQLDAD